MKPIAPAANSADTITFFVFMLFLLKAIEMTLQRHGLTAYSPAVIDTPGNPIKRTIPVPAWPTGSHSRVLRMLRGWAPPFCAVEHVERLMLAMFVRQRTDAACIAA